MPAEGATPTEPLLAPEETTPDSTTTVAQDEFGNVQVTKWSDQTFEYNVCPS